MVDLLHPFLLPSQLLRPNLDLAAERYQYLKLLAKNDNVLASAITPIVTIATGAAAAELGRVGWRHMETAAVDGGTAEVVAAAMTEKLDQKTRGARKVVAVASDQPLIVYTMTDEQGITLFKEVIRHVAEHIPVQHTCPQVCRDIRGIVAMQIKDGDWKGNVPRAAVSAEERPYMCGTSMSREEYLKLLARLKLTCFDVRHEGKVAWFTEIDLTTNFMEVYGSEKVEDFPDKHVCSVRCVTSSTGRRRSRLSRGVAALRMLRVYPSEKCFEPEFWYKNPADAALLPFRHLYGVDPTMLKLLPKLQVLDLPFGLPKYPLDLPHLMKHLRLGYGAFNILRFGSKGQSRSVDIIPYELREAVF